MQQAPSSVSTSEQPQTQVVVSQSQAPPPPSKSSSSTELFTKNTGKQYAAEFLGTFLLVLAFEAMTERVLLLGRDEVMASLWLFFGAVVMGLMVTVLVYMLMWQSGAHFNPAVTFGVMFRFDMVRKGPLLIYILVQLLAAAAASLLYYYFFRHPNHVGGEARAEQAKEGESQPFQAPDLAIVFVTETIFVFLLVLAYFTTIYTRRLHGNQFFGVTIGAVYTLAIIIIGPDSGGLLNPAFWFGTIIRRLVFGKSVAWGWIYPAAHLAGALIAAVVAKFVFGEDCSVVDCNSVLGQPYRPLATKDPDLAGGELSRTSDVALPFAIQPAAKNAEFFFKKYHDAGRVRSAEEQPAMPSQARVIPSAAFKYQQ